MKKIPISVFRAKCCEILEHVQRTRVPIRVTRYNKPFADVRPSSVEDVGSGVSANEIPYPNGESAGLRDGAIRRKRS